MGNQESRRGRDEDSEEEERRDDRDRDERRVERYGKKDFYIINNEGDKRVKTQGDFTKIEISGRVRVTDDHTGKELYAGEMKDSRPHGMGKKTDPDGTEREGRWNMGEYQGSIDQWAQAEGGLSVEDDGRNFVQVSNSENIILWLWWGP